MARVLYSCCGEGQGQRPLLDDLGYGMMCEYPRHFDVQMPKFLANLDRYRQNIARILEFLPDSKPVAAVAR